MAPFSFEGQVPTSKSLLNRALILASFTPLRIEGDSLADDVTALQAALGQLKNTNSFHLGDGGTTLRFFALRISREVGRFELTMGERLFRRPQKGLLELLQALGCRVSTEKNKFIIESAGWRAPAGPLLVASGESSQFASAIVLNAWNLPFALDLKFAQAMTSQGYFEMTLELCRRAGMQIETTAQGLRIPALQKINAAAVVLEPDVSSLFALATLAALAGQATFYGLPAQPLQPDMRFVDFMQEMGVPLARAQGQLTIRKAGALKALRADLGNCPDLLPVLAVLCAFAQGRSVLRGAPQLKHKESDRIETTAGLLRAMGVQVQTHEDGLELEGPPVVKQFVFEPDQDHRLAMAAGVLMRLGWPVILKNPQVVNKSFPEFWRVLQTGPHFLIGHRGTGKSSLQKRAALRPALDSDAEIERESGQAIHEIFANEGEAKFRERERVQLNKQIVPQTWVATGAGAPLEQIAGPADFLWVRREGDLEGRIFLDRPRLQPELSPLEEFKMRAEKREPLYAQKADRIYTVPEGLQNTDAFEQKILNGDLRGTGGVVTMLPSHLKSIPQLGAELYELRDDLLSAVELRNLFFKLPVHKILYSLRRSTQIPDYVQSSACRLDWALELSHLPSASQIKHWGARLILSTHVAEMRGFAPFANCEAHLKFSPRVETFAELKAGHDWQVADPERRSFLPRSLNGRWNWYRLRMKGRMALNFWREGGGSSRDQPTLYQWLATPAQAETFAAILGAPVAHSWTPLEHRDFFAPHPVWAIEVAREEWTDALPWLQQLGLRAASVTSPLKEIAARTTLTSDVARALQSVNTIQLRQGQWHGHNTDLDGFREAARLLPDGPVVLWGGGGTLAMMRKVLPFASSYSAQKAAPRDGQATVHEPRAVVWAAPRAARPVWPPAPWHPQVVLDLNYAENSAGREYALRVGARYISGETMFRAQAAAQRAFWKDY